MFRRPMRRRTRRGRLWPIISQVLYLPPQKQYMVIIVSAITMATFVFSGFLLFRQSDHGDLMTRGRWYMKQGKAALAVKEFEQMVHLHRNSYQGYLELGKAYMEISEPEKAAKAFRMASRLKAGNLKESGAHVAISRVMIAQGKYEDAEKQLLQAYQAQKKNKSDPELLMAIVDLYEDWGDNAMDANPPNYEKAFEKYAAALRYVRSYTEQKPVYDKLVKTGKQLADIYGNNKEYDKALAVLKLALRYEYNVDNVRAIAAMYEQKEDLDKAIYWYRKAYELDPKVISLTLSGLLIRKGKELNEAHLPQQAEKYFAEAKAINETVKLPLETLYPVAASDVNLSYKVNPASFDLSPEVTFNINNNGSYPISFMAVKVFFLTGDQKLGDAQQVIATSRDPLAPRGQPRGSRQLEMSPGGTIPMEDLEKGKLRVRIMVTYSDSVDAKWIDVKNAEITVKEARGIQDVKNHHSV